MARQSNGAGNLREAQYRALAQFRFELRRFLHFSESAARQGGVHPQQHQLLLAIKGLPADEAPTISHIAARLQVEHNSAVELVDRTAERGLIRRAHDARDRRRVLLELTAKGERLLEQLSLAHQSEFQDSGPRLLQALMDLLSNSAAQARRKRA
jgi:DNA-binding MarR family transcriptional regulator